MEGIKNFVGEHWDEGLILGCLVLFNIYLFKEARPFGRWFSLPVLDGAVLTILYYS